MKNKIVDIILIIVLSLIQGFVVALAIFEGLQGLDIVLFIFITFHFILYIFILILDLIGGLPKWKIKNITNMQNLI